MYTNVTVPPRRAAHFAASHRAGLSCTLKSCLNHMMVLRPWWGSVGPWVAAAAAPLDFLPRQRVQNVQQVARGAAGSVMCL